MAKTRVSLSLLLFGLHFITPIVASDACYWPNGDPAKEYVACQATSNQAGPRACCDRNDQICFTNGLCFSLAVALTYRGACTDQSWQSGNCPQVFTSERNDTTANMYKCPGNDTLRLDSGTCNDEDAFHWDNPQVVNQQVTSAVSSPAASATSSASATTTNSLPPQITSIAPPPPVNCPAAVSGAANQTCPEADNNGERTVGIAVGLGTGLPLLALAAALAVFWRKERSKRIQSEAQTRYPPNVDMKGPPPFTSPQAPLSELGNHDTMRARELES